MLRRIAISLRDNQLSRRAVRGRIAECEHVRCVNEEPHRHRQSHGGNGRMGHDLFTKKSHHMNTSVLYLVQNLFPNNKDNRTISLNSQYMVVFKNRRDASQMTQLARQMYQGLVKLVQGVLKDVTSIPYGYLLVYLKQHTPEDMRLRTTGVQYVYLPKV